MHTRTRVATWLVALAVLVAQSGLPPAVRAQAGTADAAAAERVERLELLFTALADAVDEIPRDTWDPAAILEHAPTPEAMFAWVRNETTLVPYRGALRGPRGVLMDRLGNSLDRALLLSAMLQHAGIETRLARGELGSEVAAQDLGPTLFTGRGSGQRIAASPDALADTARYARALGIDDALLAEELARARDRRDDLTAELARRVEDHAATLLGAVAAPAAAGADEWGERLEALRDHWWVQYRSGETWIDLDPTLPSSAPGATLATVAETVPARTLEELPADLRHTLDIRVVLECAFDGVLVESVLLESPALAPAALFGDRIAVQTMPVHWPADPSLLQEPGLGAALAGALREQSTWVPVLRIGPALHYDLAFDDECGLSEASQALDTMRQVGGGVADAFGGAFDTLGLGDPPPAGDGAATGSPTAYWLEYVIRAPGAETETIRRAVFDVIGPAARTAPSTPAAPTETESLVWRSALIGETEILPLVADLSPRFVEYLAGRRLVDQRDALIDLARLGPGGSTAPDDFDAVTPLPGILYDLALARQAGRDARAGVYLDRLNVLSRHAQIRFDDAGDARQLLAFDIVTNDVAIAPSAGASAFEARLRQGVLDANAEAALIALACLEAPESGGCTTSGNAADALEASSRHALTWRVATDPSDLAGLPWPEAAIERVRLDLLAGHTIVLPEQAVPGGATWWRIDPLTGTTLSIGGLGWGTAAVEYTGLNHGITILGGFAFCVIGAVMAGSVGGVTMCVLGAAAGVGGMFATGVFGLVLTVLAVGAGGVGGAGWLP